MNRDLKFVPRKLRLPIHILVALLLLGLPGVLRADALEDSARQLAAKIAAALSPGEAVALDVRNLSSLGPADVAAVRRAELLSLAFDLRRPAVQDVRLRQAVALSIDRSSIVNVLLQKQGEAAGGLLPQWLSGYAFLFPVAADVERAKQLRHELSTAAPLALVYDSDDALARAMGISVRVSGARSDATAGADVRLIRLRLASPDPRVALDSLLASLGAPESLPPAGAVPEQLYAAERALVESFRVVPLAHLPETYGLGPRLKNWMPRRSGGWRLEDLWLDTSSRADESGGNP